VSGVKPAVLVLEDGTRYQGRAWGATGETLGELVFNTGMTGYQEAHRPQLCRANRRHDRATHRKHGNERRG